MEAWALRGMQRWPNVPALFGWLALDRRGQWLIRGETISRPQIIDTINRNYEADAHGRWFFQNGPQRGYVTLATTPLVLRVEHDALFAHTGQPVTPSAAFLDEEGGLSFQTDAGAGSLLDTDLEWALGRMSIHDPERKAIHAPLTDEALSAALAQPSGTRTAILIAIGPTPLPLQRLDAANAPERLHFVRDPQPRAGEKVATRSAD